ncbi:MAG TPA: hypothetical protein VGK19_18650 [Capsulimonadaceae bacterium]|jgi:hypothetical protein
MFIVVSHWEPLPGKENEIDALSAKVRESLRLQPGVQLVEAFSHEGGHVVVVIYRDREVYERIVAEAESPFEYIVTQTGFDKVARYVGAEAGEAFVHE